MISKLSLAACAAIFAFATPAIASDSANVKQTIRTMVAKSNAGDDAGMLALCTADGSIIDEFAPFHWGTFADWGNASDGYDKANAITASKISILKFNHVNIDGGHAYAVTTATYSYKENGKPRKETSLETFTLEKQDQGWRITSLAWFAKGGVDAGADADAVLAAAHNFASMASPPSPPPTAITDEFAPYHWTGANAQADWFAGWQKDSAAEGATDAALHLSAPTQMNVNGDKAFAVFPTVITYKLHGKPQAEHGAFAFAFDKSSDGWHIASWAWATR